MQIANKESILAKKSEQRHEVQVDRDNPDSVLEVWVRDITFFDIQKDLAKEIISKLDQAFIFSRIPTHL